MNKLKTITIQQFCTHYDVPESFIENLDNYQLIKIIYVENNKYIDEEEIHHIEKLIRLHYHLNINFEGLDVVVNLLNQIEDLKIEVNRLNNRLDFYK